MKILPLTFKLLVLCGCWQPFTTRYKRIMYYFYTTILILLLCAFILFEFVGIVTIDNVYDFIEYAYIFLTATGSLCKVANILMYRKSIVEFGEILTAKPCRPTNLEERQIQERYNKAIRSSTLQYAIVIEMSVASAMTNSFLVDIKNRNLPYRIWLPFDYTSTPIFYIFYLYQFATVTVGSVMHVGPDALICGLLLQICCQFEILECRFKTISKDRTDMVRKCIQHYNRIHEFAKMVNDTFKPTIFYQYFVSALVLCVTLCQLLETDVPSMAFLALVLYLSTLLIQIFLYCWHGNEVKLKSIEVSDMIFASDWIDLNNDTKRILLIAIVRAATPIEFTSAYMVTINLESFMALIKTSYTAYSVLQQTQK